MKFNIDSPVFQFLGTLVDFVALNLLFLITCIPVITIGPALSALYTVTMREARGEHGYILKPYLQAFRSNFTSGVKLFLIYLLAGAIFLFNIGFWMNVSNVVLFILIAVTILYIFSFLYVFALNARFENTIKQTIKNSLCIPFTSPGTTLCMALIPAAVILLCWLMPAFRILVFFFGFSFVAYCESFLLVKVFKKFEPEEVLDEAAEAVSAANESL